MNKLDKDYQNLLQDILDNGVVKQDRTGTGTKSVFGRQIRHNMRDGFPLLTTKDVNWSSIVTELVWFLRGDTNIKFLVDRGCNIWNGDAYKNYCKYTSANSSEWEEWMRDNGDGSVSMFTRDEFVEKIKTDIAFAKKWGELGPIYGKQWREWSNYRRVDSVDEIWSDYRKEEPIDQIANLISEIKTNPDSGSLTSTEAQYAFSLFVRSLSG